MNRTTIWALLLVGALTVGAPLAAAGASMVGDISTFEDGDVVLLPPDVHFGAVAPCDASLSGGELSAVISELSESAVIEETRDQDVSITDNNALLGIALANNGARGITFNSLRDFHGTMTTEHQETRVADFERDDVFSALALGVNAQGSSLEALACVSDVTITERETTELSRNVDLDETTVLLAIALANSVGSPLELDDIASISESARTEIERDQNLNVDREDAFLALALGAGGR